MNHSSIILPLQKMKKGTFCRKQQCRNSTSSKKMWEGGSRGTTNSRHEQWRWQVKSNRFIGNGRTVVEIWRCYSPLPGDVPRTEGTTITGSVVWNLPPRQEGGYTTKGRRPNPLTRRRSGRPTSLQKSPQHPHGHCYLKKPKAAF